MSVLFFYLELQKKIYIINNISILNLNSKFSKSTIANGAKDILV